MLTTNDKTGVSTRDTSFKRLCWAGELEDFVELVNCIQQLLQDRYHPDAKVDLEIHLKGHEERRRSFLPMRNATVLQHSTKNVGDIKTLDMSECLAAQVKASNGRRRIDLDLADPPILSVGGYACVVRIAGDDDGWVHRARHTLQKRLARQAPPWRWLRSSWTLLLALALAATPAVLATSGHALGFRPTWAMLGAAWLLAALALHGHYVPRFDLSVEAGIPPVGIRRVGAAVGAVVIGCTVMPVLLGVLTG